MTPKPPGPASFASTTRSRPTTEPTVSRSSRVRPLDLLATDARLPDSLCRSLDMLSAELADTAASPNDQAAGAAQRLMGRMSALVNYAWLDQDDPKALLRQLNEHGRDLHDLLTDLFFNYPVHDVPAR